MTSSGNNMLSVYLLGTEGRVSRGNEMSTLIEEGGCKSM